MKDFPPKVAEKTLLGCQRCCCICHKFCGSKMELHHIRQPEDGGDHTLANCIPLCFDCHADVKAYNPKHPKGRKYTESEVRGHRDMWFEFCKNNPPCVGPSMPTDPSRDAVFRPLRLDVRNALLDFVRLCLAYRSRHPHQALDKTRELTNAIDSIKNFVEAQGPLSIPELKRLYADIIANAWNFQRLLDRQDGPHARPINSEYATLEDNLDGIEDWFAKASTNIKTAIDPYLTP